MKPRKTNKSTLRLITAREVKKTFGRFFAIFAIIAIGVGFFAGLRITTPVMVHSVDRVYRDAQFFDYRLVSTLGWEEKEVEALRNKEDVSAAEGAWEYDVLLDNGEGMAAVYTVHSLPDQINFLMMREGRLPEKADECLMDDYNRMGLSIGDTVTFSKDNDKETFDAFDRTSFTVVGFADTSLYLNYERGTTSIGNGMVDGYIYLPKDAFAADYYTDIYVKLTGDEEILSDAYNAKMDAGRKAWEAETKAQAGVRYDDLYAEGSSKIDDAKAEFDEKKADGEAELADAKQELNDAEKELTDAKQELDDGAADLEEAEKKLSDARAEIDRGEAELAANAAKLKDAEAQLASSKAQLDSSEAQLREAGKTLDETAAQLREGEKALSDAEKQLAAAKDELDKNGAALAEAKQKLDAGEAALEAKAAEVEAAAAAGLISEEEAEAARAEIEAARAELAGQRAAYEAGMAQYEAGQAQYEAGKARYEEQKKTFQSGKAQYEAGRKEYEKGKAQFEAGKAQYEAGLASYQQGLAQFEAGKAQIASGKADYEQGVKDYEKGKADYESGLKEYEDGLKEYQDGLREYEDGVAEFNEKIADAEQKIADAEEELNDLERPDTWLLERNTNIAYASFESDSQIIRQVARVFPLFFMLVAALVCITTMTRMVEEQRGQIGVLKGLGYSQRDIIRGFMIYAGSAAVLGCAAGYAAGIFLFPIVIWRAYQTMYIVMPLRFMFDLSLFAGSLAAALLCSLGTTYLACRSALKESAASLLRPRSPKAGKRVFIENIPVIWDRMSFMRKVSVRNIFRYKKRLFMMIVGIGGCTALLLAGFGLKDSIAGFAEAQFDKIQVADAEVIFRHGTGGQAPKDVTEAISEIGADSCLAVRGSWDALLGRRVKSVDLVAPYGNDLEPFFKLRDLDGNRLDIPEKGDAIVSVSLASRYGVEVGDQLTLRSEDMTEMTVNVTVVFENHVYDYVFISPETLLEAAGEADANALFVNFPEEMDVYEGQTALASCSNVSSVMIYKDFRDRIVNTLEALNYVVLLVILSAAALAFVVLYNLTNINIIERIREIATIKVLGFFRRETSDYIFRENLILTAMGAAAGLGLGILLHRYVMSKIVVDLVYFPRRIAPVSFILAILLTFGFTVFVNLVMSSRLDKINMAESLKAVE